MLDVAQIKCDQTGVTDVDDIEGTRTRLALDLMTARMRKRSGRRHFGHVAWRLKKIDGAAQ